MYYSNCKNRDQEFGTTERKMRSYREEHMLKRKLFIAYLALGFVLGFCSAPGIAEDTPFVLDNAHAAISGASYDPAIDLIKIRNGAKATYTVGIDPDGVFSNGIFDIYLEISKTKTWALGSTPLSISINQGSATVPIIESGVSNSPFADLNDKGLFLCLEHVRLKAGDTITIAALPGFFSMPGIGDMVLYRPGEKVAVGYNGGAFPEKQPADPKDPLSGLQLVWLGSSVTQGMMANGYSMADYLEERHRRLDSYKYAVSGTTLVDTDRNTANPSSYVSRMKQIPVDIHPDYFIVQLSTNDASSKPPKPIGSFEDSTNLEAFDTSTVYGAIQYIIMYAARTWNCPVVFFTGTENSYSAYADMRAALLDIRDRWGIGVIDLYKDLSVKDPDYNLYMKSDMLHPTYDGYKLWWGPVFEKYLTSFVTGVE